MFRINEFTDVETSRDLMEANIVISRERYFPDKADVEKIIESIRGHIKYGLDETAIRTVFESVPFDTPVRIASGTPAQKGEDAKIIYNFSDEKPLTPKLLEDGTVDYKELDTISKVVNGDVLAQIIPHTEGIEGTNVLGEKLPAVPGKRIAVKAGKNTSFSEDGLKITATSSGLVRKIDGKITVENVYTVDSIGVSTGNIDFDGSVVVKNDLLNGFTLKTTGLIEIRGKVEGGEIRSDADVLVRQGIQGYGKYKIENKGNLSTKFLENAIIRTEGNITAEAIMHSDVESGGNIICIGKKGLIVGGTVKARLEVIAKTIGSTMATATVIEVGADPKYKEKYATNQNLLKEYEPKLQSVSNNIQIFEMLKKAGKLDGDKETTYNSLLSARSTLISELDRIKKELIEMEEQIKSITKGRVRVSDRIYPGVKIMIGDALMFVRDELQNCTLYRDGADIRIGPN